MAPKQKTKLKSPPQFPVKGKSHQQPDPVDYEDLYEWETHRDWDLLSFEEQATYIKQKGKEQTTMSRGSGSGGGATSQIPAATLVTLEILAQTCHDLGQALGLLSNNMTDLTKQVSLAVGTCP